jgi:hypothetical protein
MNNYESLRHTKWECKFHIVFIPKCRRKVLYGQLRRELGPVLRELAKQRESNIEEGHLQVDWREACRRQYAAGSKSPERKNIWVRYCLLPSACLKPQSRVSPD